MTRQHQVAKSRPAQTSVKRFDTHSQHGPSGQETPCPVNSLPVWPSRRTLTATGSLCRCTRAVVGSPMALRISTVLGIMIMTFIRLILGTGLPPVNLSIIASRLESIWILRDEEKAWQKTGRVKAVILACEFFWGDVDIWLGSIVANKFLIYNVLTFKFILIGPKDKDWFFSSVWSICNSSVSTITKTREHVREILLSQNCFSADFSTWFRGRWRGWVHVGGTVCPI